MPSDLTTNPLHFEAQPAEGAPPNADLLGTGMLVAWVASRVGLAKKHAKSPAAKQLAAREITGREFLISKLNKKLMDTDVDKKVAGFLYGYTHRLFLDGMDHRDGKALKKLLGLHREDEIAFSDDYLATFKKAVKNPFLVPDSWEAFDRFAAILDARWEDFQKTKFEAAPPKGLYEKAVKARDAVKVTAIKQAKTTFTVDAGFTDQLVSLVGKSLGDKAVKDVLAVAGLPIGKKIDEQALPALGVSYMGAKIAKELSVTSLTFYRKNIKTNIRGLGGEVAFAQYPGPLPKAIAWTDDAKSLRDKLGEPGGETGSYLRWSFGKFRLLVWFERKRITRVSWHLEREE